MIYVIGKRDSGFFRLLPYTHKYCFSQEHLQVQQLHFSSHLYRWTHPGLETTLYNHSRLLFSTHRRTPGLLVWGAQRKIFPSLWSGRDVVNKISDYVMCFLFGRVFLNFLCFGHLCYLQCCWFIVIIKLPSTSVINNLVRFLPQR